MELWREFALIAFIAVLLIIGAMWGKSEKRKHIKGIKRIEGYLSSQNFYTSRYVGKFDEGDKKSSFFLYVDDRNKKWLLASPANHSMELVIRDYSELLDYGFFDIDSDDILDNIHSAGTNALRGGVKVGLGAITGAAIGGIAGGLSSFGGGRGMMWGSAFGGLGGMIAHHLTDYNDSRPTAGYGLAIKTQSSILNDGAMIFNFLRLGERKPLIFYKLSRGTSAYKAHINVIAEMCEVFEYIKSNV